MKTTMDNQMGARILISCNKPLDEGYHGNAKAHNLCAREFKKQQQKKNYQAGNSATLLIQKKEKVLAQLYEMEISKRGISYISALEYGLKFNCPSISMLQNGKINFMFDRHSYSIETVKD